MRLRDFVGTYADAHDLRGSTVEQLEASCAALERHAGGPVTLEELSTELMDGWIGSRLADGKSRRTIRSQRSNIICLWREAHELSLAPKLGKVRIVKVPPTVPIAWWPDEFTNVLAATENTAGAFSCGIPRRLLLRAFFLVGYYTGLRTGDMLALRTRDVLISSRVVVVMSKTQEVIDVTLPEDCMDAIRATLPETRDLVFPVHIRTLREWVCRVCENAKCVGSPKFLRRTGATRCEQVKPGSATLYLGHKRPDLAWRHYIDRRQIDSTRPMPPKIA